MAGRLDDSIYHTCRVFLFYAALLEQEWNDRDAFGTVETVAWLRDQQHAAFALVKVHPHARFDE